MKWTYRGTCDHQLNLALVRAHQLAVLLADLAQEAETVVLGEGGEEVLDDVALVARDLLLELCNDLALVVGRQHRRGQHRLQVRIVLEQLVQRIEASGRVVERLRLRAGRPLADVSAIVRLRVRLGWTGQGPSLLSQLGGILTRALA